MIGLVDDQGRALLEVRIRRGLRSAYSAVTTWIDTAFDGHWVMSLEQI